MDYLEKSMLRISILLNLIAATLLCSLPSHAGQGFTCIGFLALSQAEQIQYLEGYTLGAAMEMKYFRSNLFSLRAQATANRALTTSNTEDVASSLKVFRGAVEYTNRKYNLVNIAVAYPDKFHSHVLLGCNSEGARGAGMFDILPSVLRAMQETGKYEVAGM
jgi:hypothetical protein